MIKLLIINDYLHIPALYRRWELFAEQHDDFDVTLLVPSYSPQEIDEGINKTNFHLLFCRKKNIPYIGWISSDFKIILQNLKPDIIYNIGAHNQLSLFQLIKIRNKYLKQAKLLSFSMRGPNYNLRKYKKKCKPFSKFIRNQLYYYYASHLVNVFNKNCDAVFCHYPDALKCFRDEGYNGPIYMQTQVGVNSEVYHENKEYREEIRKKYLIPLDTYVFVSAVRTFESKGIFEIIEALPQEGNWKYIIMGTGNKEENIRLKKIICERQIDEKVILPGFISSEEMPKYWNAADCVIHFPKTTYGWVETFSVALVQGMITAKPVICSDSGSVPYQVGPDGIIVHESDVKMLQEKIIWVLSHQNEAKKIGLKMRDRANKCFSIQHLNKLFYSTLVEDVLLGNYDKGKVDMTSCSINDSN